MCYLAFPDIVGWSNDCVFFSGIANVISLELIFTPRMVLHGVRPNPPPPNLLQTSEFVGETELCLSSTLGRSPGCNSSWALLKVSPLNFSNRTYWFRGVRFSLYKVKIFYERRGLLDDQRCTMAPYPYR